MDDTMKKISPADLPKPLRSAAGGQSPATPTTIMGDHKPTRTPIESVTTTVKSRQFDPCPLGYCDGSGWYAEAVPYGHPNFGKPLPCACRQQAQAENDRQRRRQKLQHLAGEMGGELMGCQLDNYDIGRARDARARTSMLAALAACRAYAEAPIGWIYLYGPTGVGKSHLAAATTREILRSFDVTVAYVSEPQLMKYIREGWGQKGDDSTDARIQLLQEVDLLILDDLGTEHRGKAEAAWADAQILALLMPRYQFDRWTIITSNLPIDQVDEPRIRSRILGRTSIDHTGREQRILVDNSDQRDQRRKK